MSEKDKINEIRQLFAFDSNFVESLFSLIPLRMPSWNETSGYSVKCEGKCGKCETVLIAERSPCEERTRTNLVWPWQREPDNANPTRKLEPVLVIRRINHEWTCGSMFRDEWENNKTIMFLPKFRIKINEIWWWFTFDSNFVESWFSLIQLRMPSKWNR